MNYTKENIEQYFPDICKIFSENGYEISLNDIQLNYTIISISIMTTISTSLSKALEKFGHVITYDTICISIELIHNIQHKIDLYQSYYNEDGGKFFPFCKQLKKILELMGYDIPSYRQAESLWPPKYHYNEVIFHVIVTGFSRETHKYKIELHFSDLDTSTNKFTTIKDYLQLFDPIYESNKITIPCTITPKKMHETISMLKSNTFYLEHQLFKK